MWRKPQRTRSMFIKKQIGLAVPTSFALRFFNSAELKYGTNEFELLAVVWVCKNSCTYLLGNWFEILTDHKPIFSAQHTKIYSHRSWVRFLNAVLMNFCNNLGIEQVFCPVGDHCDCGLVERAVQTKKRKLRTEAFSPQCKWLNHVLHMILKDLRSSRHTTLNKSPFE